MKFESNKEHGMYLKMEHKESEPSLVQVLLHNDEFTPMEFVVNILEKFFFMDRTKATEVMVEARMKGRALCGMFTKDFAEAKVTQIVDYARTHEHPLICSLEAAV